MAVLDALASYVKKLIVDMAEEEVSMLLGVSGEIQKLENNMESIKAFLADAERKRLTDQSVQRWVRKLKDAMYDATDILDLCQLEAEKRRGSTEGGSSDNAEKVPSVGCFHPLLFCLWNPVFAHKIGGKIKDLNRRLDDIHKGAAKFDFIISNNSSNSDTRMLTDAKHSSYKTISEFDETAIVGEKIEQDTRELAQMLITGGNQDIKVVSIVGTGGMGKTTLAQKILNEPTVQEHFKLKVWLSTTKHFDEVALLKAAIEHAGGVHGGTQDKSLLTRTLTNSLSTGRFFLVLDDLWSVEAWSQVFSVPIRNASQKQPGSWVLITTRFRDLAQQMGASFFQHHVSALNEEDAWALLKKQLPPSPNQVAGIDDLRDVGMKIVRKCDGLPLAVKVMGGLLSTRPHSERDWEDILNHHAWSVRGLPEELDSRIYLSYEDLSPQLKQCFLYCSLLPKVATISQRSMVSLWISEGFVQPRDGMHDDRLEEIATEYYEELIRRNLIEPKKGLIPNYVCTMHDVVRSFAEIMAREDSLVVQDSKQVAGGSGNGTRSVVRRMSVPPSEVVAEWSDLQKQGSLVTLMFFGTIHLEPGDSLACFSRLRVLLICGANWDGFVVGSLCKLRHLRYFQFEGTNISRLPEDIHRMKFLQHIGIVNSSNLENLPRNMIKLAHLRTLDMFNSYTTNAVIPKGFGELTNLRRLLWFPVHMDDMDGTGWCSLEEIGPLLQLRKLTLHGLEHVPAISAAEMARIGSKEHLDYLELHWSSSGGMESMDGIEKQHAAEDVLEKLCPPPRIQNLFIEGYFGRMLPNWMMVPAATGAFKSLMFLKLEDLSFCTKLPDGLCRLPSLKLLDIVDAPAIKSVGPEFQAAAAAAASVPVVGGGVTAAMTASVAFPNLINLVLEGLREWQEWDWAEEQDDVTTAGGTMAMPALEELGIRNCKLRCLPPGLANSRRHALRRLYLYEVSNLASVENFPSVVELDVFDCPELKRISGLSRLHKIRIVRCPNLEVLEAVPSLDSLSLLDTNMEALPGYLQAVNPRYLVLTCSKELYEAITSGSSSSECDKISHIAKHDINYS